MTSKEKAGFVDDAREKLKEIGWFVAIGLLRWLIEYLTAGNPGKGDADAEGEHKR